MMGPLQERSVNIPAGPKLNTGKRAHQGEDKTKDYYQTAAESTALVNLFCGHEQVKRIPGLAKFVRETMEIASSQEIAHMGSIAEQ